MKTYIVNLVYPTMFFEAESEEAARDMAIAAIGNNEYIGKYIMVEVEDEHEYRKALEAKSCPK